MRCGQCDTINETKARFCIECGHRLVSVCPACSTENPPAAKFCAECGSALPAGSTPPAAVAAGERGEADGPRAERRLVSVLFADLVGFTPFAEERDAEDVRETLTRYFDLSREVIERYGGTVEKFIGDAVMAVWGAPVAHEDDAERAVRAAVELVDAVASMDDRLQARVAVQTGEAAVTLGAVGQGMVAGDMVNTAARVQAAAEPGTVLVNEATMRSAADAIAFEPAGDHELKGKRASIALWQALRIIAERGGRGRSDGLEAPFVGRDTEFRLLKELFHASSRERRVRMISVTGQGGIGKSRLAWELEKYLDGLVEPVWYHHGRSPSYGNGIAFWALGEMVRGRCGLAEGDDEATTRTRVTETVARFVPEPSEREWIGTALLTLLGIGDGAFETDQLFPAWRTFFEHIARQGTTLLVFEDLQWADPGLLAFIDHVMSWSRDLPMCLVVLTRPELVETNPDWGTGHRVTSIVLAPLDRASMEQLLAGLVPGLPAEARDRIVARAAGIPLYAVETVRMLTNDGRLVLDGGTYRPTADLTELEAPESLRALVASRLDALDPDDRSLLQSAAVIGHTFSSWALAGVTGVAESDLESRLRQLVRREFLTLEVDTRSPERGQFTFAQELLREVAYETLSRDDRRVRHLAAARYFEGLDADELAGALAAQYQSAYRNARPGEEADALAVQARLALRGAAQRAEALGSTEQAQELYVAALELASEPLDEAALLTAAARAAVMAGNAAVARPQLERAIAIYRELGRRSEAAQASAGLVDATLHDGWQPEAARAVAQEAAEEYADLGDDEGFARILSQLARLEMLVQESHELAIATADRALAMAERLDLPDLVADTLITRGSSLASCGRTLEGIGAIEAGRRLAHEEGLAYIEGRALVNIAGPLADRDPRAQAEASQAALEIARRIGSRAGVSMALNNLASAATSIGEWDPVLVELRREVDTDSVDDRVRVQIALAITLADRGKDVTELSTVVVEHLETLIAGGEQALRRDLESFLGQLALAAGRFDEAIRRLTFAAEADPFNAAPTYATAALAALLGRDVGAARTALAGLGSTGSHGQIIKLDKRRTQAGIDALEGRDDEALSGFRSLLVEYRRLELPFYLAQTDLALRTLLDSSHPEVGAAEAEARSIFEDMGAGAWLGQLDDVVAGGGAQVRSAVVP